MSVYYRDCKSIFVLQILQQHYLDHHNCMEIKPLTFSFQVT